MCERPKIHVFLGAPPPPAGPASVSGAGLEGEECPPAGWRHLELTWRDRRLRPATGEADWMAETTSGCRLNSDQEDLRADAHRSPSRDAGSIPGEEAPCSASILEYLDSCFPAGQQEPGPGPGSEPPASQTLSAHTQFLSAWTLSQALILRARRGVQSAASAEKAPPTGLSQTPPASASSSTPELFSPVTPSLGASAELFSQPPRPTPTPRAQEAGVVVEATADGVLCSQEAERPETASAADSPSKSPEFKKARLSEDLGKQASVAQSVPSKMSVASVAPSKMSVASKVSVASSVVSKVSVAPLSVASVAPSVALSVVSKVSVASVAPAGSGLRGPTTLLLRCDQRGVRYSVLVAVVHPCYLKEVKVKSGPSAGSSVPLASVVVTDQSAVEMKVVLWRRAAFWALTVSPGDILLITGLQLNEDRWRGETLLQSSFSSKLLNLGQITACSSPPAPQHVSTLSLSSLCGFLRERRPLLVFLKPRPPQDLNRLPYATLRSLRVNTLVHALLRVTHTHVSAAWRSEAESRCRSAVQLQAVVTVEQPGGQQGALLLWGPWTGCLASTETEVLLVREGLTSDLPELHSTPWSSVRPLDPTDSRAHGFLRPGPGPPGTSLELDVDTLLSQKYSGDVELRVQIISFQFLVSLPSQNAPQPVLDCSTSPAGVVAVLSGDITYTGCGGCGAELDADANGIYSPCYPCLPRTAVRRYYRPGVLTVSGQSSRQVFVQVPPDSLQKILEAPPDKLHRNSAPGSEVKHVQLAAERIQTLLSLPRKTIAITVCSHFLCDENSVPIDQDFTLLDLQFPR
ncbi:hypothetical protein EPR50_G00182630 [Perca flavescens]|uniref:Uncharacterized protein n=1 Tax=Perca flavescens TaxID=8167 RepID=A0A484CCY0_PERFV|nr:hypothetical protein EPR50_G00182630 [Perca flavescens]